MSSQNGHSLDPIELACLPPDDPHRQALHARLAAMLPDERATWEREWALTDRLRAALAEPLPPATLESQLLAIPQQTAPAKPRSLLQMKIDWRVSAALILVVGLIGAYFVMNQPAKPAFLQHDLAHTLATYAVKNHAGGGGPLAIASSDPVAVQKALASEKTDFPVIMLQPTEGVTLKGGGICDFGSTKAAYTQWQGHGTTYTLYEFNGKNLGVPAKFFPTTNQPQELWHDQLHYQVFIFAGSEGKCCWCLTMETEQTPNVFSQYGSVY